MSAPESQSSAPTLPLCVCCHEPDPLCVLDRDLDGRVCDDCRQKLRAAVAWMKPARIMGCTKARNT